MRHCQRFFGWMPQSESFHPIRTCENLINLLSIDGGDYEAPPVTELPWFFITPGNVHFNFIIHLVIVVCGVIIGLSKSPNMHPAQYLFQKKFNEKEKQLLDELWIVLEEKLEVRKQLLTAREVVSERLTEIDQFETRQEDNEAILSDLKHDLMVEQEQVSIARDKLQRLLANFSEMGNKVLDQTQSTSVEAQMKALKQLKARLNSHSTKATGGESKAERRKLAREGR